MFLIDIHTNIYIFVSNIVHMYVVHCTCVCRTLYVCMSCNIRHTHTDADIHNHTNAYAHTNAHTLRNLYTWMRYIRIFSHNRPILVGLDMPWIMMAMVSLLLNISLQ